MSRIIEFRKSAQKAEKQSVQGKTCAFTGHRPQSLPFGFDESDKRCTSLKSVMRDQIVALIENEGVTHFITGRTPLPPRRHREQAEQTQGQPRR